MLNAGVPDGVGGSIVIRPTPRLRLHAGGGYNLIAPGICAGASLSAFPFWITPSLALEAGRSFSGNANSLAAMLSGKPSDEPALADISYDYAAARVGIEIGTSRVTFFVHAGMSVIQGNIGNLNESLQREMDGSNPSTATVSDDANVRILSPSAKAGLVVYF